MLYYCNKCKKVTNNSLKCEFCNSLEMKVLKIGTSVNVIGSKQKGKVFKITGNKVKLIIIDEANNRLIKEYNIEQLKKIL